MFSSTGKFSGTEQDLADRGLRALFSIQCIAYKLIDPKPELLCRKKGTHSEILAKNCTHN